MNNRIYTVGGIGDILHGCLGIEFIIMNKVYDSLEWYIYTHAPVQLIAEFVEPYKSMMDIKIKVLDFENFRDMQMTNNLHFDLGQAEDYKLWYQNFELYPFEMDKYKFKDFTIIVHPFGSKFSSNYLTKVGYPTKDITYDTWRTLMLNIYPISTAHSKPIRNSIGFYGTRNEIENWPVLDRYTSNLKTPGTIHTIKSGTTAQSSTINNDIDLISEDLNLYDIKTLYEVVCAADLIIAADSSIKTMSLIAQKPTILVIYGDYADPIRDAKFIEPYENRDWYLGVNISNKKISNIPAQLDGAIKDFTKKAYEKYLQRSR